MYSGLRRRRELALTFHAQEKRSFGKAREPAGMDRRSLAELLGERQIPRPCGPDELEEELRYVRGE